MRSPKKQSTYKFRQKDLKSGRGQRLIEVGVASMNSPDKTLLVEQISYAEEALERLKEQLHELLEHIDYEHQRILEELKTLEEMEDEVDTETFNRVSQLLQDAWIKAMSASTRLEDMDRDLSDCDATMMANIAKLKRRQE